MNILLFGATGETGLAVLREALRQGHTIKAYVRNPAGVTVTGEGLSIVQGSLLDTASIATALQGVNVVVSTLGARSMRKHEPVLIEGVQHFLEAMQQTGVKRLLFVSGFGVGESLKDAGLMSKLLYSTIVRVPYADKLEQEKLIKQSGIDWTIIRPTRLKNGPAPDKISADEHLRPAFGASITREGVAQFIVKQVTANESIGKCLSISG